MKPISISIIDPSGHKRIIRVTQLPFVLGTQISEKNNLKDSELNERAAQLELRGDRLVLKTLHDGLSIRVGDLRFPAIEVPMEVQLQLGGTTLRFLSETSKSQTDDDLATSKWRTVSESGLNLIRSLKKASLTKLSIYLNGETGTGKEVLAHLIHEWSDRALGPFVPMNCGALPLSLVESELFGHVKGAFTGAVRDRPGAFLQAHGGTLFLDEVGDLPTEIQVKILRFLESGEIRPVGSDRVLHADVRVVCATHKPLDRLIEEGKFRQDLYFRLASIPIEIPNLRSRPDDIKNLAQWFAEGHQKTLTPEAILRLQAMNWPGNVRELRHAMERAAGLAGPFEPILHCADFDFLLHRKGESTSVEVALNGQCSLEEMEKMMILRALRFSKGNRTQASKALGVARSTLFEMLKRHRIMGPKVKDFWLENR